MAAAGGGGAGSSSGKERLPSPPAWDTLAQAMGGPSRACLASAVAAQVCAGDGVVGDADRAVCSALSEAEWAIALGVGDASDVADGDDAPAWPSGSRPRHPADALRLLEVVPSTALALALLRSVVPTFCATATTERARPASPADAVYVDALCALAGRCADLSRAGDAEEVPLPELFLERSYGTIGTAVERELRTRAQIAALASSG